MSDDRITRETLSNNNPCPSSPSSTIYIYIYIYILVTGNHISVMASDILRHTDQINTEGITSVYMYLRVCKSVPTSSLVEDLATARSIPVENPAAHVGSVYVQW